MLTVTLGNSVLIPLKILKFTDVREFEFYGELIRSCVVEKCLL